MIDLVPLDRPGALAAAEGALHSLKSLDAEVLRIAAHWADLHDPVGLPPAADRAEERRRRLNGDHGVQLGGEGTPQVLAGCLAELGVVLEASAGGARHLVADALDLRHRLPRIWAEVADGRTRAWRVRQVASATRSLPASAMPEVDAGLAGLLTTLPWARFATVLEATVKRAAPHLARAQEEEAAVRRIAEILEAEGDTDPTDVRRSKAVGSLGQPARALALLTQHSPASTGPHSPGWPRRDRVSSCTSTSRTRR